MLGNQWRTVECLVSRIFGWVNSLNGWQACIISWSTASISDCSVGLRANHEHRSSQWLTPSEFPINSWIEERSSSSRSLLDTMGVGWFLAFAFVCRSLVWASECIIAVKSKVWISETSNGSLIAFANSIRFTMQFYRSKYSKFLDTWNLQMIGKAGHYSGTRISW